MFTFYQITAFNSQFFCISSLLLVVGIGPRASHMQSAYRTAQLQPHSAAATVLYIYYGFQKSHDWVYLIFS